VGGWGGTPYNDLYGEVPPERETFYEGLPGVLGNKGTLGKYCREQGNINLFLGKRGTKLCK